MPRGCWSLKAEIPHASTGHCRASSCSVLENTGALQQMQLLLQVLVCQGDSNLEMSAPLGRAVGGCAPLLQRTT